MFLHFSSSAAIENSLDMKFVLVPAGEFLMGSDESPGMLSMAYPRYEHRRVLELGDEASVHRARLTQAFYFAHPIVTGFRRTHAIYCWNASGA